MTKSNDTPALGWTKIKIQQRRLKVKRTHHSYQLDQDRDERIDVGEIHLKGHWLIEAGFLINAPVKVRVMPGCLVLTTQLASSDAIDHFEQLSKSEQRLINQTITSLLNKKLA